MTGETARASLTRPGAGDEGRQEILGAAAEVFSERGYAATTVDDIADRLNATKGRIYHYYRGKADIFLDVHRVAMEVMLGHSEEIARQSGSALERLRAMARGHALLVMREFPMQVVAVQGVEMHHLSATSDLHRAASEDVMAMRDRYERLFIDAIAEGQAADLVRDGEPALMSKAILGSLNWITMWYRPSPDEAAQRRIADEFSSYVVDGLRGHAG